MSEKYLFTEDASRNAEDLSQCGSEGAQNCVAARLNSAYLTSSPPQSPLKLLPGSQADLALIAIRAAWSTSMSRTLPRNCYFRWFFMA